MSLTVRDLHWMLRTMPVPETWQLRVPDTFRSCYVCISSIEVVPSPPMVVLYGALSSDPYGGLTRRELLDAIAALLQRHADTYVYAVDSALTHIPLGDVRWGGGANAQCGWFTRVGEREWGATFQCLASGVTRVNGGA